MSLNSRVEPELVLLNEPPWIETFFSILSVSYCFQKTM